MDWENDVKIVELTKANAYLSRLQSKYSTSSYYDLSICRESGCWQIELRLRPFEKALEKNYQGRLFEDHIEDPRVFAALLGDKQIGWIELGYEKWNNRMRVWEFLVTEECRKKGVGTMLMKHAVGIAKEKGARMLVLETQTNNAEGIRFYLELGFDLIGFDASAYTNEDVEKKEIRLELGLKL